VYFIWYNEVNDIEQILNEEEGTYMGYTFRKGMDTSPTSPDKRF
jgi:hypothetical protein